MLTELCRIMQWWLAVVGGCCPSPGGIRVVGLCADWAGNDCKRRCHQGATVLEQQELLIKEALLAAQPYQLGGAEGLVKGWGRCLGLQVTGQLMEERGDLALQDGT